MRVSDNEFTVLLTKAGLGAGVPRGVVMEIAQGCLLAIANDRDPLPNLLQCFEAEDRFHKIGGAGPSSQRKGGIEADDWIWDGFSWKTQRLLCAGTIASFVDFAMLSGDCGAIAEKVDHPEIVLACALWRAAQAEKQVQLRDGGEWHVPSDMELRSGTSLHLRISGESAALKKRVPVIVKDDVWQTLNGYARRLLVANDAASLADAGAGSTDND